MDTTAKGMAGDWMDGSYDPRSLLDKIIRSEEAEVPLYNELARNAPNEHLRKTIEYMARQEREEVARLRTLYDYLPPGEASLGRPADESFVQRTWVDGVKRVRDMEIRQCLMLCRLALNITYPHVFKMILDIAAEEMREAQFWNDILIAYGDNSMACPGVGYPGYPGYAGPVYPGPGYGGLPGVFFKSENKDIKK